MDSLSRWQNRTSLAIWLQQEEQENSGTFFIIVRILVNPILQHVGLLDIDISGQETLEYLSCYS